jgi:hypothetical protein
MRSVKSYKINESWGINCTTVDSSMSIEVVMLFVPWLEVVDGVYNLTDKEKANKAFKELADKYKGNYVGFLEE